MESPASFSSDHYLCERSSSKYVRNMSPEIKIEDAVRTIDVIESYRIFTYLGTPERMFVRLSSSS